MTNHLTCHFERAAREIFLELPSVEAWRSDPAVNTLHSTIVSEKVNANHHEIDLRKIGYRSAEKK